MSESRDPWLCTLCNEEFEPAEGSMEAELRCPKCMRKTGLVKGVVAHAAAAPPGNASHYPGAPGGAGKWRVVVMLASVGLAGVGGWFGWQAWKAPSPQSGFEEMLSGELTAYLDVAQGDARLASCDTLKGYAALVEKAGKGQDSSKAVRPASVLLDATDGLLPAEALLLGLACIRDHGPFAVPCRVAGVSPTVRLQQQAMGLCEVHDGEVAQHVVVPADGVPEGAALEALDLVKGAALVLATGGSMASEPSEAYRLFGAALSAWEDPRIRFQLGEAKVRFNVLDFASEDMAKALTSGYDEGGVMRLAEVQSRQGNWGEALGLYGKVLQENATAQKAKLGKIRCLLGLGKMADAEPLLNELEKSSPDMEELNHVLAAWHLANKRGDEALAALKREFDVRPSPASGLSLVRATESVKGAEAAFGLLNSLPERGMELELEKLRLALILGNKEEVARLAEALGTAYPDSAHVQRACGLGFFEVQQLDKAEHHFEAADTLGGAAEFESLTYLTLVRYMLEGSGKKGTKSAQETLAMLEQRHKNARLDVALSLEGLGLWNQARGLLEELLAKDAMKVDAAVALYGLYLRNGDPGRADALRQRTLAALPEQERIGVETGFQHEKESVESPEDTPSSASMPQPQKKQ